MKKIFDIMLANYKKTACLLGALSALAFPPVYAFPLFILSLCLALKITDNVKNMKQSFLIGYCFGISYFIVGLYWICNALLVDFLTFGWLYPISLLAIGGFFGLFMIPPFLIWYVLRKEKNWVKIFSFASVWVLLEILRSFILTGFPWNLLGTIFAFHEVLIQTASIWGTYGLSLIALVITGCFYIFFESDKKSSIIVLCVILSFIITFGLLRINKYETVDSNVKIRLVQPSIPQSMKWDRNELENNFKQYIDLSAEDGLDTVDFVVWGETALPFDVEYSLKYREMIKNAIPQNGYLITGLVRFDITDGIYKPYNSMYVLDKNVNIKAFYDKNHLVPFGEYVPFRKYLPDWVQPIASNVSDFMQGEKYKNVTIENYPVFAALICYEIIFPDEVINRNNKPNWLVVLTNDGWYGKSSGPYQHLVSAQMRSIEEGITIVRSANSGISAIIYPTGKIMKQVDLGKKGYMDVYLPEQATLKTLYSKFGKYILLYTILVMLVLIFITTNSCKYSKIQNNN